MAENLQKYLSKNEQSLIFNNRTMSAGDNLKSLGASPVSSFGELVKKSDVVFTMVNSYVQTLLLEISKSDKNRSQTTMSSRAFCSKLSTPRNPSPAKSSWTARPYTRTPQNQ